MPFEFELEWDEPPEFMEDELGRFWDVYQEELEKAAVKIATRVEKDARENAPVGETGNLHNSIESDVKDLVISVGTNTEYAPYVEFGTENEDGSTRMEAQPYLRPAWNDNQDYIEDRLEQAWNTAVRRVS